MFPESLTDLAYCVSERGSQEVRHRCKLQVGL